MTDRHALPRAAGSIRLIGEKKNHRLSRWVAFLLREYIATYLFISLVKVILTLSELVVNQLLDYNR